MIFVLFCSNLIQSQLYDERSFIPAFLKVSIDHLVWKKKLLFWKKRLEKVLNFGSKNLYEPWTKEINVLFIAKPQDHFFCFVPQSLDAKSEF